MRRLWHYFSISFGSIIAAVFLLTVLIGYTQPGLQLTIQLLQTLVPGKLTIHQASGQLFRRMQFESIEYRHQSLQITLTHATLHWQPHTLLWHVLSIRQFTAEQVRINQPTLSAAIPLDGLSFPIEFGLRASGHLTWHTPFTNDLQIQLTPIDDANTSIAGHINLQGDIHQLTWDATLTQPWPIMFKGRVDDQWDVSWQATVEQIHSQGNITGDRKRPQVTTYQQVEQFNIGDSAIEQAMLRLYFEWGLDGAIQGELLADNVTHNNTHIEHLQLLLDGSVADHQLKINLQQPARQWQTIIDGQYNGETWQAKMTRFHYQQPDNKNWHLNQIGTITVAPWRTPATVQLVIPKLDWLSQIWPSMTHVTGQLHGAFRIDNLHSTDWSLQLAIENGQASLPELNIDLRKLNFTATKPIHRPWEFKGQVYSKEGQITLQSTAKPYRIQINGDQFTLMDTDEFLIKISPSLELNWEQLPIKITGDILIPTAKITPLDYSQTIHLPRDVVFIDTDSLESSSALQWLADIVITLGDDVFIDFSGISAQLVGQVNVIESTDQPTHATGQIDLINGQFRYLNQTLKLDYGHIYYTNSLLDEPNVRVQASKEIHTTISRFSIIHEKTIVGVQVEGLISDPQVKLFSKPTSLSQSDILSLLVLGKTISEASSGFDSTNNSALLVQAAGALGLESSDTVQQVRNAFGIDQFSLETEKQTQVGSIGNVIEKTSLVIGKALSPRLFVSYHINLLGQQNRFSGNIIRLRYLLRPKLILQTETDGKDNAVDLLYIIELK